MDDPLARFSANVNQRDHKTMASAREAHDTWIARLVAIQKAMEQVPTIRCMKHYQQPIWEPDYPAIATLVASWVGPLEEALNPLFTDGHLERCPERIGSGACMQDCRNLRAALSALPGRT